MKFFVKILLPVFFLTNFASAFDGRVIELPGFPGEPREIVCEKPVFSMDDSEVVCQRKLINYNRCACLNECNARFPGMNKCMDQCKGHLSMDQLNFCSHFQSRSGQDDFQF